MTTVNQLIDSLNNIGGADCEIAIQPLGFGRELLRVSVTMPSANDEHRVINTLGQHISNIAPSQVSYSNVEGGVRLNAVYFIPTDSVPVVLVDMSEATTTIALTNTDDAPEVDSNYESGGTVTISTKRKGR